MPKEKLSPQSSENFDVATLYSGTKMRYILEAFDLGKGTKEEKQARKSACFFWCIFRTDETT